MAVASGKSPPAPREAATRLKNIVDSRVGLAKLIIDRASQELQSRGYLVVPSASGSDATLRFVVYHGLGVAGIISSDRGISMTVNMELSRTADGKRLLFSIANQVTNPDAKARVRFAPYAAWFSDESLTVEQYRLVAESLVAQSLQGM